MALIALVSAKGSPGVTTTALMLAAVWPRPLLVAECDPAGGDVAAGFYGGAAEVTGGVLAVASAFRHGVDVEEFFAHAMPLDQARQRWVLPGFNDPAQAGGLARQWGTFAEGCEALEQQGIDVIADCGRLQIGRIRVRGSVFGTRLNADAGRAYADVRLPGRVHLLLRWVLLAVAFWTSQGIALGIILSAVG